MSGCHQVEGAGCVWLTLLKDRHYTVAAQHLSLYHNILLPVGGQCVVNVFVCLKATFLIYCLLTSSQPDSQDPPASGGAIQYNITQLQYSEHRGNHSQHQIQQSGVQTYQQSQ